MDARERIERSIITTYRKTIWRSFTRTLSQYRLIQPGDHIAACISGGKDSFLMAKCLEEIQRHGNVDFKLSFLVMDPGYHPMNRRLIEENAELMGLDIRIFETDIFDAVAGMDDNPCYMCARMRRGHLYKNAQRLGANKIALGHHFDDVIETVLLSMLYGGEMKTMMPKLRSTNFPGMELIRPMYMVREKDIVAWRQLNHLTFLNCACRFTECSTVGDNSTSKRAEIKALIAKLEKGNSQVPLNIFRSVHNIKLGAVIGYTLNGEQHSFLDDYDQNDDQGSDDGLII